METLTIISHPRCCSHIHSVCMKADRYWKSPLKIMHIFNVTSGCGINNLWRQKSSKSWTGLLIAITICLLVSQADARPAAGPSRSVRDHSRSSSHYFISSSSSTTGNYINHKAFNSDGNGSGDTLSSLSIFSPLDVLRQNMLLEIQRRKLRHAKHRIMQSNQEYLDRVGR